MKSERQSYHLVGIAGVGMSALAQALHNEGCRVSGSDRFCDSGGAAQVVEKLLAMGIGIVPQDGSGVSSQTSAVVISTAIEEDNNDLIAARRVGSPIRHRAEVLAELSDKQACIAVTGTSGKSTVTGMIGCLLESLGADPSVVNGAPVLNWINDDCVGNVRKGDSRTWVVEADESDRSHLNFHPDWAVVTNISKDHFDVEETTSLFERFVGQAREGSVGVVGDPDFYNELNPVAVLSGSSFCYAGVDFTVPLLGRHNAENAFCAVKLCERLGFDLEGIAAALRSFRGIQRRLETVGKANGVTVVDDYSHNPAKIRAALETVGGCGDRTFVVWRPHGFGPLRMMMDDLANVFQSEVRESDKVYILPVYDAGGTADRSVNSEMLVEKLQANGVAAKLADCRDDLVSAIAADAKPGDVVLTMGARDPDLPRLARDILDQIRAM